MTTHGGAPYSGLDGEITFIGTATVLLRIRGFNILTDPNFLHSGEKAHLGMGLRSRRLTEPAMQVADLPPLDAVVLSHFHGDHFDRTASRDLDKSTLIVTEPHAGRKLRRRGFSNVVPLRTWESHVIERGDRRLSVEALPGKHAPGALSPMIPPVMGSLLVLSGDGAPSLRVYITGDTLFHDALAEIPRRYPVIDLCLIHLGGTRLAGVLLTMDDRQGVKALELVKPRVAVPVHYDDYSIFKSPLEAFLSRAAASSLATEVREVRRGETWRFDFGHEAAA
jgi:L-ascorbate metabolism protein UlaG (beta-lactamase superfamily)